MHCDIARNNSHLGCIFASISAFPLQQGHRRPLRGLPDIFLDILPDILPDILSDTLPVSLPEILFAAGQDSLSAFRPCSFLIRNALCRPSSAASTASTLGVAADQRLGGKERSAPPSVPSLCLLRVPRGSSAEETLAGSAFGRSFEAPLQRASSQCLHPDVSQSVSLRASAQAPSLSRLLPSCRWIACLATASAKCLSGRPAHCSPCCFATLYCSPRLSLPPSASPLFAPPLASSLAFPAFAPSSTPPSALGMSSEPRRGDRVWHGKC